MNYRHVLLKRDTPLLDSYIGIPCSVLLIHPSILHHISGQGVSLWAFNVVRPVLICSLKQYLGQGLRENMCAFPSLYIHFSNKYDYTLYHMALCRICVYLPHKNVSLFYIYYLILISTLRWILISSFYKQGNIHEIQQSLRE